MGQWALSGYSPVGRCVYEMTFKHFQEGTEGLIINVAELLLARGGEGEHGDVGRGEDVRQSTH